MCSYFLQFYFVFLFYFLVFLLFFRHGCASALRVSALPPGGYAAELLFIFYINILALAVSRLYNMCYGKETPTNQSTDS